MVKVIEMDEKVTLNTQLQEDVGAVILINEFTMNSEDVDQFLKTWASAAEISKKTPGVISLQLHRGIAGSCKDIVGSCKEDDINYKTMEIGALVGDKVYFIEYFAEENYYSKYFPTIQKIIDSVELIK
jgi:quinol monooxygenase YgiN